MPFTREDVRVLFNILDEKKEQRVETHKLLEYIKNPSNLPKTIKAERVNEVEELYERIRQCIQRERINLREVFQFSDHKHNQLLSFEAFNEAIRNARIPLNCFEIRTVFDSLSDSKLINYATFINTIECSNNQESGKENIETSQRHYEDTKNIEDSINMRKSVDLVEEGEVLAHKTCMNAQRSRTKPETARSNLTARILAMSKAIINN
jgi:Ca2+-binding EF-hand superfamily protein